MTGDVMQAMVLRAPHRTLEYVSMNRPRPATGQLLLKVDACGVCRTDLRVIDGERPSVRSPIVPGHEIVGTVIELGDGVDSFACGDRVGVPWLASTCGVCSYCLTDRENLFDNAGFTGYTVDGGYAQYAVADYRFCFAMPTEPPAATLARTVALRGAHRLSCPASGGRGPPARLLWIRCSRAHRGAGRSLRGTGGVRVYPPRGYCGAGLCADARRSLGRDERGIFAVQSGRGHHLRPGWRPRAVGIASCRQGRKGCLRRHPY